MKILKVTKPYSPYAPGDICTVEDEVAEEMLKADVAVEYKKKAEKDETETDNMDEPVEDKMVKSPVSKK